MISFSQFLSDIHKLTFPSGEAKNLTTAHRVFYENALIKLQTHVDCLKDINTTCFEETDLTFTCNVSQAPHQRSEIQHVYAFKPGFACKRFVYQPADAHQIHCWVQDQTSCNDIEEDDPENADQESADFFENIDDLDKHESNWKCAHKMFAWGPNNTLFFAPAPPKDYVIAVHWKGVKRNWNDTDLILDDQDLKDAVSLYVEYQRLLRIDEDLQLANSRKMEFMERMGDIHLRCRRDRTLPGPSDCISLLAEYYDALYVQCQNTSEATTDATSESTSEATTKETSESTSEATTDETSEATTEAETTCSPADAEFDFDQIGLDVGEGTTDDVAGTWGVFGPGDSGFGSDPVCGDYCFDLSITESGSWTLDWLEVRLLDSDQEWTTGQIWSTRNPAYYPLVVFLDDGTQQNFLYTEEVGGYSDTQAFKVCGQIFRKPVTGEFYEILGSVNGCEFSVITDVEPNADEGCCVPDCGEEKQCVRITSSSLQNFASSYGALTNASSLSSRIFKGEWRGGFCIWRCDTDGLATNHYPLGSGRTLFLFYEIGPPQFDTNPNPPPANLSTYVYITGTEKAVIPSTYLALIDGGDSGCFWELGIETENDQNPSGGLWVGTKPANGPSPAGTYEVDTAKSNGQYASATVPTIEIEEVDADNGEDCDELEPDLTERPGCDYNISTPAGGDFVNGDLFNIDFGADPANKTGLAAIGLGSGDFWNGFNKTTQQTVSSLKYSDGRDSNVEVQMIFITGATVTNESMTHEDDGYATYLWQDATEVDNANLARFTFLMQNVASGTYDVYVYAHGELDHQNASVRVISGATTYGPSETSSNSDWDDSGLENGRNYVKFSDVVVVGPTTDFDFNIRVESDQADRMVGVNMIQIFKKS